MITYKNILFSTDFSENARAAIPFAVDLAKKYGATLHVVHVYLEAGHIAEFEAPTHGEGGLRMVQPAGTEAERKLQALCEEISREIGSCKSRLLRGKPAAEIVRYAKEAAIDLIVMSSHGLTGFEHVLFGSTAEKVLRESPCNVYIIKRVDSSIDTAIN
ncbi:MAG: universal stress protein [Proteobacteria bacterium]|nr:universal stress protein [Pseudomonadota bacterium]